MKGKVRFSWKILIAVLAAVIAGDAVYQATRTIVLQGFFSNDEANLFPAGKLAARYAAFRHFGGRTEVSFADDLFVVPGSRKAYPVASAGKIVAYTAARELDFLVTTRPLLTHYLHGFAFQDLKELMGDDSPYTFIRGTDATGKEKAVAIDLCGSRYLRGKASRQQYCIVVPENSRRKEETKIFLTYLFSK